ncbi:MAG: hypothetical protein CL686_03200 [Candidatus Nitrosopelagicus sp.]|nr:hypothetical protein [Candidatus Nitrosopelagicus sp.]
MAESGNNNERGQKLEGMYNAFMGDVSQLFPKTDSNLLLNVMALERKFPDMMPHVHLEVVFNEGVDINVPKYEITEKYHVQAAVHRWDKNILVVTGMMNVGIIAEIADHKTVEKISGTANAAFY